VANAAPYILSYFTTIFFFSFAKSRSEGPTASTVYGDQANSQARKNDG